jgi:hypothetical protein
MTLTDRRSRLLRAQMTCFGEVMQAVDNDLASAARVFDDLAAIARRRSRKPKGAHNPEFDRKLLKVHDNALKGQKAGQIRQLAKTSKKAETAIKMQLSRLLKKRELEQKEEEAFLEAMVQAILRGDQQTTRDAFVDRLEKQLGRAVPDEMRTGQPATFEEIQTLLFGNK